MKNILLVFCLILIPFSSGALEIGNINDERIVSIETPEAPLNISNLSVLSANIWNTTNQGPLSSTAQINHNLLNNLAWSVAGHTMDTFLNMSDNDIINVGNITANFFIGNGSLLNGIIHGIWESVSGFSQLITPEDIDMQDKNLVNVTNITLISSIKDSDTQSRVYFDSEGAFVIEA